jgi:aspartate ammonia-lyase
MSTESPRLEHEPLEHSTVFAGAYYGAHTARAVEMFSVSGVQLRSYPNLIKALAMVKLAAARANLECGRLTKDILVGIEGACQEIIAGKLHDQFPLDIYQGGAGAATNVNMNEVIANRALELMGHGRGEHEYCDPQEHVNASQSTHEVYSTALHVAMALGNLRLLTELRALISEFRAKARETRDILKIGLTELQDDGPMTLGQEFGMFAETLSAEIRALAAAQRLLCEVRMGASAIAAGSQVPEAYFRRCVPHLVAVSGLLLCRASDPADATEDTPSLVRYSSCMKSFAITLSNICNDLRLLSSGPRYGLNEINLPPVETGSTPGKVNPVILEIVNMVCFRVIGSDQTVSIAAESGPLQLNVFEPLIAACILEAQTLFISAVSALRAHCVRGITANAEVCRHYVDHSIATVSALHAVIGYERATQLAAEALRSNRGIVELIRERGILTEQQIVQALGPCPLVKAPVQQTSLTSGQLSAPPDPARSAAT